MLPASITLCMLTLRYDVGGVNPPGAAFLCVTCGVRCQACAQQVGQAGGQQGGFTSASRPWDQR